MSAIVLVIALVVVVVLSALVQWLSRRWRDPRVSSRDPLPKPPRPSGKR